MPRIRAPHLTHTIPWSQQTNSILVRSCVLLLVGCQLITAVAFAQDLDLQTAEQNALRIAAQSVAECVVQIETLGGLERVERMLVGTGPTTGLIVSEDGYLLSSAFNFVQQPASILVTLPNGQRKPARIIARDHSRMLVMLKVDVEEPLPVPTYLARDEIRTGQWSIAVGRAFSNDTINVSVGIISGVNRIWGKAIQTDAKISPANYGGPLVDLQGRVMGILVPLSPDAQSEVAGAEWYDSGIGFAIPLAELPSQLERLKSGEDLHGGILGISLKGSDLYGAEAEIGAVQVNSPAADAELKPDDVIVQANGQPISRQVELKHVLGPLYAGDTLTMQVRRADQLLEFSAVLTDKLLPYERPFMGLLPTRINDDVDGVVVRAVFPESPATIAGLLPADRIVKIDDAPIASAEDLRNQVASRQPGDQVLVEYQRDGETLSATLELGVLPDSLPEFIGEPESPATAADAGVSVERGTVIIKIPEEANECQAFVPHNYRADLPFGLVISLHKPGSRDAAERIERWKETCERHHLVLLVPQAQDDERWLPTEVSFIRKAIDTLRSKYSIADERIVVHGNEGGGTMAYLFAFRHLEIVRGVMVEDAALPGFVRPPANDPLLPLAIVSASATSSSQRVRIDEGLKTLREQLVPVTIIDLGDQPRELTPDERKSLGQWVDSLDRI